jgi:hypothetical protein
MELPPSGWYPDPYGVPGLLRWWDGSVWTPHTHASGAADGADGARPAETGQQATVQPTAVQPAVQPTTVQPTTVQPTTVQPAVQATRVQPAVGPTAVQPAVQPTAVQPTTVQPAALQPGAHDANGTQVLFLGDDAWSTPGMPDPAVGSRYGYLRAQRQRRIWLMGGLAGGTAVALGLIALVVSNLASTPPAPKATHHPTPVAHTSRPVTPTPSPTPSATPSALVSDATSGLSYAELSSPWQPTCPNTLNGQGGVTWTAGESAIAAQINGGQTPWYGEACSAQLPQQYGYNGVADLENVATNLTNNITGSFYNSLQHTYQQVLSQPLTVGGHAGWEVTFQVSYVQGQGPQFDTEQGAVVVADLGAGVAPAVFFTSIPNNLSSGNVDTLVSSLRLAAAPQPGGGGSPGDGSPGDGGGGNGN